MSKYYLLEKRVKTCSSKLRDKFLAEGYALVAVADGYNATLSLR